MPKGHTGEIFQSWEDYFFFFLCFCFLFGTAWRRRKVSILLLSCYIRTCHEIREFLAILGEHWSVLWNQFVLCLWDMEVLKQNLQSSASVWRFIRARETEADYWEKRKLHVNRDAQSISLETFYHHSNDALLYHYKWLGFSWREVGFATWFLVHPQHVSHYLRRTRQPAFLVRRRNLLTNVRLCPKGSPPVKILALRRPKHQPSFCDEVVHASAFYARGPEAVPPRLFPMSIPFLNCCWRKGCAKEGQPERGLTRATE